MYQRGLILTRTDSAQLQVWTTIGLALMGTAISKSQNLVAAIFNGIFNLKHTKTGKKFKVRRACSLSIRCPSQSASL